MDQSLLSDTRSHPSFDESQLSSSMISTTKSPKRTSRFERFSKFAGTLTPSKLLQRVHKTAAYVDENNNNDVGQKEAAITSTKKLTEHSQSYGDDAATAEKGAVQSNNICSCAQQPASSSPNQTSKLYESFTNKEFHDVVLIAAEGTEITTHRCVLAKYSKKFADIFKESTVVPARIELKEYDAATIQAALDFMFDKHDSISGRQMDVFKFANQYAIVDIKDACRRFFEESVDPSNVCDYVQIAYTNDFDQLKKKCLKIMVEKKKEIDSSKWNDLPKDIIIDAFCC